MSRRSGLGKGLAALIPDGTSGTDRSPGDSNKLDKNESRFRDIPLGDIEPNPFQPRQEFGEERMAELTRSVQEVGVLQPVLVREVADGYELVVGERRWRAAKRAGLATIPAIVRVTDDRDTLEQAIVENIHRDDLNSLEEAFAYHRLVDEFEMTQHQVAVRVGRSRPSVANALRLLHLPTKVQRFLLDGQLSGGHGRALAGLSDRQIQETLALRIVDEGLSVRQTEELVRRLDEPVEPSAPKSAHGTGATSDPGLLEVEQALAERLDTTVKVTTRGGRGRIIVTFADRDDLQRIFGILGA